MPVIRRSRVLVCGIILCVLSSGSGTAAADDVTKCAPTVCAISGATIRIDCTRPDASTVKCQAIGTVWGQGRSNSAVGLPGAIQWRGEGRCGGACSGSELITDADAWNGVTGRSSRTITRTIRFAERTSRSCMSYTAGVGSYTEATTATLSFDVDQAEARKTAYAEVIGFCPTS